MMVQAGLYTAGSDPELDVAIRLWPLLDGFLAEAEPGTSEDSFARLRRRWAQAEIRADRRYAEHRTIGLVRA